MSKGATNKEKSSDKTENIYNEITNTTNDIYPGALAI